ncbi:Nucleoside-diphosphate-sugar epimerase [Reichenbachiella faecimaris]|uniref:Nucleoside-diphosphate-sugar epimerase n=1 Tax=Reichenbachiella faecimaris TaxID=692418 RepID=A0A1W2G936_REIFA|nr:NAD(P)-dependent oxidoreductase [Reichenbachiella faecimaris]SMD33189.1 Nucleoside-diphosphate-sugar epimerase [Reichenbachiella faecimaris]
MNIIITGATGFIGKFLVDYALAENLNVFAAVRKSSNRTSLAGKNIGFVELDLTSEESLTSSLNQFVEDQGTIDYVIHNAGITKTTSNSEYELVNCTYTINLIKALENTGQQVKKFTLVSSLAASSPGTGDQMIKIDQVGEPVSAYGWSKKKAEEYIEQNCSLPYVILRPPPVFGPGDKDMFPVFDLVNKNLELYVGGKLQLLSFIYVKDLARGIVAATTSVIKNKKYFLSDNGEYDNEKFNLLIKKYLAKKTLKIKLPLFVVYVVAFFSEIYTRLSGNLSQLNIEKIKELKCSNWMCDSRDFYKDLAIEPKYTLYEGIQETIDWYRNEHWLK